MRVRGEGRKRREENIDLRQENRRQHRTEEGAFYTARTTVRSVAAVDEEEEEERSRPFNLSCGSFFFPLSLGFAPHPLYLCSATAGEGGGHARGEEEKDAVSRPPLSGM